MAVAYFSSDTLTRIRTPLCRTPLPQQSFKETVRALLAALNTSHGGSRTHAGDCQTFVVRIPQHLRGGEKRLATGDGTAPDLGRTPAADRATTSSTDAARLLANVQ